MIQSNRCPARTSATGMLIFFFFGARSSTSSPSDSPPSFIFSPLGSDHVPAPQHPQSAAHPYYYHDHDGSATAYGRDHDGGGPSSTSYHEGAPSGPLPGGPYHGIPYPSTSGAYPSSGPLSSGQLQLDGSPQQLQQTSGPRGSPQQLQQTSGQLQLDGSPQQLQQTPTPYATRTIVLPMTFPPTSGLGTGPLPHSSYPCSDDDRSVVDMQSPSDQGGYRDIGGPSAGRTPAEQETRYRSSPPGGYQSGPPGGPTGQHRDIVPRHVRGADSTGPVVYDEHGESRREGGRLLPGQGTPMPADFGSPFFSQGLAPWDPIGFSEGMVQGSHGGAPHEVVYTTQQHYPAVEEDAELPNQIAPQWRGGPRATMARVVPPVGLLPGAAGGPGAGGFHTGTIAVAPPSDAATNPNPSIRNRVVLSSSVETRELLSSPGGSVGVGPSTTSTVVHESWSYDSVMADSRGENASQAEDDSLQPGDIQIVGIEVRGAPRTGGPRTSGDGDGVAAEGRGVWE